jgi:hypothetical protein
MRKIAIVFALTLAALMATTAGAFACPDGYSPCGESQQLCCPG